LIVSYVVLSDLGAVTLLQVEELSSKVNAAEKLKAAHKDAKVGVLQERCNVAACHRPF
jgi:hypothetical protein